jgi:ribosomal protein S18 acetylase RimI-like enzyme
VEETYGPKVVRLRLEAEPENEKAISVYKNAGFEVLGYAQLVKAL